MTIEQAQEQSEDSIVAVVLQNASHGIPSNRFVDAEVSVFEYGKKRLLLGIYKEDNQFVTHLDTNSGNKDLPHETAIVYKAARQYMQRIADEKRKSFKYQLLTKNERMRDWAQGPGMELFRWTSTDTIPQKNADTSYVFRTTIPTEFEEAKFPS